MSAASQGKTPGVRLRQEVIVVEDENRLCRPCFEIFGEEFGEGPGKTLSVNLRHARADESVLCDWHDRGDRLHESSRERTPTSADAVVARYHAFCGVALEPFPGECGLPVSRRAVSMIV